MSAYKIIAKSESGQTILEGCEMGKGRNKTLIFLTKEDAKKLSNVCQIRFSNYRSAESILKGKSSIKFPDENRKILEDSGFKFEIVEAYK